MNVYKGDINGKDVCKDPVYRSRCDHGQVDHSDWFGDDIWSGMLDNATTGSAEARNICLLCDQRIFAMLV